MDARARLLAFATVLAVAGVALAAPAMAASTYYAAPTGGGSECTAAAPCSIAGAVGKAGNGDAVVLLPGTYTLSTYLQLSKPISLGGESETDTTIQTTGVGGIEVDEVAHTTLHDFRLATDDSLDLKSGTAERVFVDYTGASTGSSACSLDPGVSLLDSVCWAHGSSPDAGAIFTETGGGTNTVTLRNDTAIAAGPQAVGLFAELESSTANFTVAATNVIVRGGGADIDALGGGGSSKVTVALAHSNYATVETSGPEASITAPGTNGNQTAAPLFLDAANGNFAEAAGSPTIDAGATEAADGPTALAGEARALPGVCGGAPITDIGAYEFVLSGCPAAATPVPTAHPPSNKIVLGKLTKNAKKGTATLVVSVPDAGTLVLTAKGIRKDTRHAGGAAKLKLPIAPVGQAKRRLARSGGAKFKLRLRFAPVGGTAATVTRSVRLSKRSR